MTSSVRAKRRCLRLLSRLCSLGRVTLVPSGVVGGGVESLHVKWPIDEHRPARNALPGLSKVNCGLASTLRSGRLAPVEACCTRFHVKYGAAVSVIRSSGAGKRSAVCASRLMRPLCGDRPPSHAQSAEYSTGELWSSVRARLHGGRALSPVPRNATVSRETSCAASDERKHPRARKSSGACPGIRGCHQRGVLRWAGETVVGNRRRPSFGV